MLARAATSRCRCREARAGGAVLSLGRLLLTHYRVELSHVCEILRTARRKLVDAEFGQPDDWNLPCARGDHSAAFPDRTEGHAADAGQHIDPDRLHAERQDLVWLRQPPPGTSRHREAKLDERLTEAPGVCLAGIDEEIEILRVSFVAVNTDREAAHQDEADAMVLQQT